ncbi:hypothetical protein ACFY1P_15920 [Streptomyces sp. NPDC001407]|uniref:hypothetical protein n=1 Tax=Streptomyces sp. NPDC001407 TaxID=3364573 RepID=UPI00367C06C5
MNEERMPWYLWLVLAGALVMSAPGEYRLAVVAGWSPEVALVMPLVVSVYGAVAAYVADKTPKRSPERRAAVLGAAGALALALAFQMTAHLMAAGYMSESAWMVAAVSGVPPLVVAHLMHMPAVRRPVTAKVPAATTAGADSADESTPATAEAATVDAAEADTTADIPACRAPGAPAATDASATATATATVGDGADGPPVMAVLPGMSEVADPSAPSGKHDRGRPRRRPRGRDRGPDPDEVKKVVAALESSGEPVTGDTVGTHFGVSARTGRRYLGLTA